MEIVLALVAAACFGTGDFAGGLASRRASLLVVVLGSHAIGLVGALVAAPFFAEAPTADDVGWGAAGGVFGLAGLALLYRGLATGPMAVVAPLSAISSAVVPLAWGLLDGERLSGASAAGVVVGLVAIVLVSAEAEQGDRPPVTTQLVIESLLAGAGFGAFFIFLDLADDASAPWPIVAARVLTTTMMVFLVLGRRPPAPPRVTWPAILAAGVFDVAANVAFLVATGDGDLSIVSVLSSLYPAATVLLAWAVLRERVGPRQLAGLGLAGVAIVLVGVG